MIIQAMLGLEFLPESHEITLRNPMLPSTLDEITVRDLQLGDDAVDFSVRRDGSAISLRVLKSRGPIRVTLILDPSQKISRAKTAKAHAGERTP
jgi:hypothetical protein